ncbi:hypothetical protein C1924_10085 [Stenotrophomonas sp. ESTM1D_MKCIP4_1]|nr:hypothetical protein C1924_10085 [Stenotrophomonas sp. ESTM1D_MKCIP4_1]
MDTQYLDVTPATPQLREEALSFHWLYKRVQDLASTTIYTKAGPVEKWAYRVGAAAALIGLAGGLLLDRWIPGHVLLLLALACLAIEIVGFLVGGLLTLRREYRQYMQPRLSHAMEMDNDFLQWATVIAELRQFPKDIREQRLRFVSALRTRMTERMGIMYGGLQRLGPFPVLIALYLQFRDWRWGDWTGVFDIGWAGAILIFAVVLLYLLGWLLIAQRSRLDSYVSLLEASLQEPATP